MHALGSGCLLAHYFPIVALRLARSPQTTYQNMFSLPVAGRGFCVTDWLVMYSNICWLLLYAVPGLVGSPTHVCCGVSRRLFIVCVVDSLYLLLLVGLCMYYSYLKTTHKRKEKQEGYTFSYAFY